MKILILKLIYPFWYFLAKTKIGNLLTALVSFLFLPGIMYFILPSNLPIKDLQSITQGVAITSLVLGFFILFELDELSTKLEDYYWKANHKINKHD